MRSSPYRAGKRSIASNNAAPRPAEILPVKTSGSLRYASTTAGSRLIVSASSPSGRTPGATLARTRKIRSWSGEISELISRAGALNASAATPS